MRSRAIAEVRNNICVSGIYSGLRSQVTEPYCFFLDNIVYNNGDGIDTWGVAKAYIDHNLVFGNRKDYHQSAIPGLNDVRAYPCFVNPSNSDYKLASNSPARGAGSGGGDIGLCEDTWTPQSAKREKDRFLGNGAMELWMQSRDPQQATGNPITLCEEAQRRATDPTLKDRIACYVADLYRQGRDTEKAESILKNVLRGSRLAHIRDLARGILARVCADKNEYGKAIELLEQTEWPQSKLWRDLDAPRYLALTGRTDEALGMLRKTAPQDPYSYLSALQGTVEDCLKSNRLDAAKAMLAGIDEFPKCSEAVTMRLRVAYALRDTKRYEEALDLLKQNANDVSNRLATENMFAMADLLEKWLGKPDEANRIRIRLVTDYYPEDSFVERARSLIGCDLPRVLRSKLILLEQSQWEFAMFDRRPDGSSGLSPWKSTQALIERGFTVHWNQAPRTHPPSLDAIRRYGLVIMHGRYGSTDDPPLPDSLVADLVSYVKDGGALLVIACGPPGGQGREPQFYNRLLRKFGISFVEGKELRTEGAWAQSAAVSGLGEPFRFRPSGGVEVKPGDGTVLARCGPYPVAAAKRIGKGRVVALGAGTAFVDWELRDDQEPGIARADSETARANKEAFVRFVTYALSTD